MEERVFHRILVPTDFSPQSGADLIAIGTHGRGGLNRLMLGSVCDRVIRLSSCPVLAVRESETA